jgi:myo-inositol-1(or 4)-monophosphatase
VDPHAAAAGTFDTDPDELRRIAIEIAVDAATFVKGAMRTRRTAESVVGAIAAKSSPTDLVTEVDRASEARIVTAIERARPDDGLQGEEGTGIASRTGLRWVIDPIDGTTNFVYGFPAVAVSVAVVDDAQPELSIAGAVVDVTRGEVYSAARGRGAWLDGEQLSLAASAPESLAHALVGTGFSYEARHRADQAAILARVLPLVRDIRRGGSAALDLCWVAAGRLDASYERGVQLWDRAAGILVAAEAGAVTGVEGTLTWVAHPAIAEEFVALVR